MNFSLLKSFVTLAESLHFGAASQALNLTQPALTKQIKRLEEDIGAQLFNRGRQGTELTDFGRFFLLDTKPLLLQFENVYRKARRTARGDFGKLEIGLSTSTIDLLSRVLPLFKQQYPDVEVALHDLSSVAQMERLLAGTLHVGFVRAPVFDGLAYQRVLSDRLALLIPRGFASQITAFDVDAIRHFPFLLLQRGIAPRLFDHITSFCALHKFEPSIVQYANELSTILSLVAAEVGISLIAESAFRNPGESVIQLPIDDPRASWDVGIAWRDDEFDPMVAKFVELVSALAPVVQ